MAYSETMIRADQGETLKQCFIDGKWVVYSFCSENKDAYQDVKNKRYIGMSEKYRIDFWKHGKELNTKPCHFWIKY